MADTLEVDDAEIAAAEERGSDERQTKPRALSARYDAQVDRIVIELANGCTFLFQPGVAQDLQNATPDQLAEIEVSPAGFALHWPQIDVDFSVAGLMSGIFGTAAFMEGQRQSEQPRSALKAATARASGKAGRRPRKSA